MSGWRRRAPAGRGGHRLRPRPTPRTSAAARAGIEPRRPRRGQRPAGREVVVSTAIAAGQPRARGRGAARAAPRRAARRAHAAEADDRRHRHARQDDDVEHDRARAAGLRDGPGLPGRRRGPLDRGDAGWGSGEWLVVEADESDRSLLALAPRIAVLTNVELDHHATYASQRDVDATFAPSSRSPSAPWSGTERRCAGRGRPSRVRRRRRSSARRLALRLDGVAWRCRCPARTTRGTPPRRSPPAALAGADPAQAAAALARLRRRRAALRGARETARARCGRRLRPPPDRGRGHDRRRAHARRRAASSPSSSRTCSPAPPARRASSARRSPLADLVVVLDVYPARERAEDFPGVTGGSSPRRPRTPRRRGSAWLPGFDAPRRPARRLRAGDLCSRSGAGDVDALGRRAESTATVTAAPAARERS